MHDRAFLWRACGPLGVLLLAASMIFFSLHESCRGRTGPDASKIVWSRLLLLYGLTTVAGGATQMLVKWHRVAPDRRAELTGLAVVVNAVAVPVALVLAVHQPGAALLAFALAEGLTLAYVLQAGECHAAFAAAAREDDPRRAVGRVRAAVHAFYLQHPHLGKHLTGEQVARLIRTQIPETCATPDEAEAAGCRLLSKLQNVLAAATALENESNPSTLSAKDEFLALVEEYQSRREEILLSGEEEHLQAARLQELDDEYLPRIDAAKERI